MGKNDLYCGCCSVSSEVEDLYKVTSEYSEYRGSWLCQQCYVDEVGEEPDENTECSRDIDDSDDSDYDYEDDATEDYDDDALDDIIDNILNS